MITEIQIAEISSELMPTIEAYRIANDLSHSDISELMLEIYNMFKLNEIINNGK